MTAHLSEEDECSGEREQHQAGGEKARKKINVILPESTLMQFY